MIPCPLFASGFDGVQVRDDAKGRRRIPMPCAPPPPRNPAPKLHDLLPP
jgi:hypothetical protein